MSVFSHHALIETPRTILVIRPARVMVEKNKPIPRANTILKMPLCNFQPVTGISTCMNQPDRIECYLCSKQSLYT